MPPGIGYGKNAKMAIKSKMRPGRVTTGTAAMLDRAFEAGKEKAKRRKKK